MGNQQTTGETNKPLGKPANHWENQKPHEKKKTGRYWLGCLGPEKAKRHRENYWETKKPLEKLAGTGKPGSHWETRKSL